MASFNCQVSLSAGYAISNEQVLFGAEGPDSNPIWTFPGDSPTNGIISTDQSLTIQAKWTVAGPLSTLMTGCKYRCQILLEKMGPAEAAPGIFTTVVPHVPVVGPQNYTANIVIPAGLSDGVYRVVLSFNALSPVNAPLPIAGFGDLGFIQVFAN